MTTTHGTGAGVGAGCSATIAAAPDGNRLRHELQAVGLHARHRDEHHSRRDATRVIRNARAVDFERPSVADVRRSIVRRHRAREGAQQLAHRHGLPLGRDGACLRGRMNFTKGRFEARTTLEPERRGVDIVERTSGGRALTGHHVSVAGHVRSEAEANQRDSGVSHVHPYEIRKHRR